MRILITCGGTGGHIFPAVGLAQEFRKRGRSSIVFVIDDNENTKAIIENAGFDFETLDVPKMPYGFSPGWLLFIFKLINSRVEAEEVVARINPDIAIGFGAYISGPVISAAKSAGIKVMIHEQNAFLGRANRMLFKQADRVCFSLRNTILKKDKRCILTGNPVRKELIEGFKMTIKHEALSRLKLSGQKKTILVLGGSRGALSINKLMMDMVNKLRRSEREALQIIHLTGRKDLREISETYEANNMPYWASDFSDNMAILYKAADIAVCRAGATTISEVALFGVPSIFIPYPWAGHHQWDNASIIAREGGAVILGERGLSSDKLKDTIFSAIGNEKELIKMAENIRSFSRSDAAEKISEIAEELVNAE